MGLTQWNRPYNVVLTCLRGLEKNLMDEVRSIGFTRNDIVISNKRIKIFDCNLRQLYFLSYFSRFATRVYFEVCSFPLSDNNGFVKTFENVKWSDFIGTNNSYSISSKSLDNNSSIKLKSESILSLKDLIDSYFSSKLKTKTPKFKLKEPEVKLDIEVDKDCNATLLVDAVGSSLSNRGYRHKNNIIDIDPTMACGILHDMGYKSLFRQPFSFSDYEKYCNDSIKDTNSASEPQYNDCESNIPIRKRTLVDFYSGCGVFLIEAALLSARIAPGYFMNHFSFQNFPIFDNLSFLGLKKYADSVRIKPGSNVWNSLKGSLIGIERDWEKLEESLKSSETAGTLDLISFTQSNYLKDGIYDAKRSTNSKGWDFMFAQIPKLMVPGFKSNLNVNDLKSSNSSSKISSGSDSSENNDDKNKLKLKESGLSVERYSSVLKTVSNLMNKHFNLGSKGVLVVPEIVDKDRVNESFGRKLSSGKRFIKGGISNIVYYTV